MDDDTSDDVTILETSDVDQVYIIPENKPLMQLFKRLIGDSKQNTVLTNSQILNILHRELNIKDQNLHELEVEIYLNIMKKYLKDWPQWDAFDRAINELKNAKDYNAIKVMLDEKHKSLKEYLRKMLDMAEPVMREIINETIEAERRENVGEDEEVSMEVMCTRSQLNNLIYRHPVNDNVFNGELPSPRLIKLNTLSLKSIFNWWNVQIDLNFRCIYYSRETQHVLKHTLINKKNGVTECLPTEKNNTDTFSMFQNQKHKKPSYKICKLADICSSLIKLSNNYSNQENHNCVNEILKEIVLDLKGLPDDTPLTSYKKHMSSYPYVRYLSAEMPSDVKPDNDKYDLHLQEIIIPKFMFIIGRVDKESNVSDTKDFIKVICRECKVAFEGPQMEKHIVDHFSEFHQNEPDWQCVNCKNTFQMSVLAENRWNHVCGA